MTILFSVISRGTTVLAKYASCAGNFAEVVEQVLGKISPENAKLTYSHGNYLFHYISDQRIIYLCITDDEFERSKAFAFLGEIRRKFQIQYGDMAFTAMPYAMNVEFSRVLAAQMRHFSTESQPVPDHVTRIEEQVDELKGIMVKNIDSIAARGEKLELLVDKTEELSTNSVSFRTTSRNLARSLWWKNVKLIIILVIVGIVVLYFVVSIACGGLDWKNCVHH